MIMDEKKQKPQVNPEVDEDFEEAPIIVVPKIKDTHEEDDDCDNPSAILAPSYSEDGHVSGEIFKKPTDVEATLKANKEAAKAKREAEAEQEVNANPEGETPDQEVSDSEEKDKKSDKLKKLAFDPDEMDEKAQAIVGWIFIIFIILYSLNQYFPDTFNFEFLDFWSNETSEEQVKPSDKASVKSDEKPAKSSNPYKIVNEGVEFSSTHQIEVFKSQPSQDGSGLESYYYIDNGDVFISDFYYPGQSKAVDDFSSYSDSRLKDSYIDGKVFSNVDSVNRVDGVIWLSGSNSTSDDMYTYVIIDTNRKCVHQVIVKHTKSEPEVLKLFEEVKKSLIYRGINLEG